MKLLISLLYLIKISICFDVASNITKSCFLVLCRNEELYEILETIQNVQDRFNNRYSYPYVFLNDKPFTDKFTNKVTSYLLSLGVDVEFGTIPEDQWSIPSWIDENHVQQNMQVMLDKDVVYADSWSYRHMCRWYTGFFYKHPLVEKYDYYWRLEPGVRLLCDVEYDVFQEMYNKNKKYAFTLTLFEYFDTIPSLWTHFKAFKDSHQYNGQLLDLIEDGDNYNLCHFWSNFEIAKLDIFRSAEYEEFFRFMDQTGGFFYERWGDAPLHTLFIALYLNKEDLWYLNDFGYYHAPYLQCPPDDIGQRCICDQDYDFTYSFQSCTSHFLKIIESK